MRLASRPVSPGSCVEDVYLNAANHRHRWARLLFPDVDDEFEFKAVWVAGRLRERLGSPDSRSFRILPRRVVAHRAAAWPMGDRVAYVHLQVLRGQRRPRLRVTLGVMVPPVARANRLAPSAPVPVLSAGDDPYLMVTEAMAEWVARRGK